MGIVLTNFRNDERQQKLYTANQLLKKYKLRIQSIEEIQMRLANRIRLLEEKLSPQGLPDSYYTVIQEEIKKAIELLKKHSINKNFIIYDDKKSSTADSKSKNPANSDTDEGLQLSSILEDLHSIRKADISREVNNRSSGIIIEDITGEEYDSNNLKNNYHSITSTNNAHPANITTAQTINFAGIFTSFKDGFAWINNKIESGHNALDEIDDSREQIYQQHPHLQQYERYYADGTDRARFLLDLVPTTPTEALIEIGIIGSYPLLKGANFVYDKGKIFYRVKSLSKNIDIDHIFSSTKGAAKRGHVTDTFINRWKIVETFSDKNNLVGITFRDNSKTGQQIAIEWYTKMTPEGKQWWAEVANGRVRNAGLNDIPRECSMEFGLKNSIKPLGPRL